MAGPSLDIAYEVFAVKDKEPIDGPAQVILLMMTLDAERFYHDPVLHGTNDIQELSKIHKMISRSKSELWRRILTRYLLLYFPEADRLHRCRSFSPAGKLSRKTPIMNGPVFGVQSRRPSFPIVISI